MSRPITPPVRAEFVLPPPLPRPEGALARAAISPKASAGLWFRRALERPLVRKAALLAVLAAVWEALARWQGNDLLLPGFLQTASAFAQGIASGELLQRVAASLAVLAQGYAAGVAAALLLTALAVLTRPGRELLETCTAMFNPLPAIALLPLAMLWLGLGNASLVFVIVHAVLWPLALSTYAGFRAVPETLRMAGRNYGLTGLGFVSSILLPAALPAILSGLKIAWAFAWRTLIAAELVFGAASGKGGLGWYIFQNRNELYTDKVFAGLAAVILIGLAVEHIIFATLEKATVRRWNMQH